MVQANELRIGNWVINSHNEYQQVFKINDEQFKIHKISTTVVNCSPIPLTPEIMESLGFEPFFESNKQYHYKLEDVSFCFNKNKPELGWWLVGTKIKWVTVHYVHEIQNLYKSLKKKELIFNPKP